jgi:hypothetical protein
MRTRHIEMTPVYEEELTPREFLKRIADKENFNMAFTQVIPPQLGQAGSGKILVRYTTPVYVSKSAIRRAKFRKYVHLKKGNV